MAKISCVIVTPEKTALDKQVDFLAVPMFDGELGIAPGHSALMGRLGSGELRMKVGATEERWFLEGGFIQVQHDRVSILTDRLRPLSSLSRAEGEAALAAAKELPSRTDHEFARRQDALRQARETIRLAGRASAAPVGSGSHGHH